MKQQFQQLDEQTIAVLAAPIRENALAADTQISEEQARRKAEVDLLLEEIKQESVKRKRLQRRISIGMGSIYGIALLGIVGEMVTHHDFHFFEFGSLGSLGSIVGYAMMSTKRHKDAAKQLARFNDLRSVGPLIEAWEIPDRELRPMVEDALIRLLPQLRANHADLLNTEQRNKLYCLLPSKNTELTLAILKGVEQVGNEKALPVVEFLVEHGRTYAIRQAAKECLLYLQPRVKQERARETLLRSSNAIRSMPETLLRPAEGVPSVDPQQLLRADLPDENAGANP